MKKTILVLLIIFNVSCCKEDDTALVCLSDCTVVQGHIVTAEGKPLVNVPIELRHNSSRPYSSSIRRIKKAITDENGYYNLEFFIESDELGSEAKGYFELIIDYSKLDGKVYMNNSPFYDITISPINRRDTTVTMDFYNPKKAYITVNLKGFNPEVEEDYFWVSSLYPSGLKIGQNEFLNSEYQLAYDGNRFYATSTDTKIDSILVAESDYNLISISKRKNGGSVEDEYHEVYVPKNSKLELTYDY